MLTVLHRGPDGSERYFEAETVTRFPPVGEESTPALGEIRASGVVTDSIPGNVISLAVEKPFGAVFVMNRYGATVAKYLA